MREIVREMYERESMRDSEKSAYNKEGRLGRLYRRYDCVREKVGESERRVQKGEGEGRQR